MDTLREFISELTQHDVDLSSSLMKAKALTNNLHSPELDEWVNSELYGYKIPGKVPEYRRFPTENYGEFAGPSGGTATDLLIPTEGLPDQVKEFSRNLVMLDGVGALQAHGAEPDVKLWPPDFVMLAQEATARSGGLFLTKAYQPIPASVYPDILEQVRHRLFDFLLDLEDNNRVVADTEPQAVGRLVNYHIYGGHNVIATGEHMSQQVSIVSRNDAGSLLDYLRGQGVEEGDLQELGDAVASEPEALDGNYGPKVGAWLGGMLTKAATGAWSAGVEAAPKILIKALNEFYGL